MAKTKNTEPEPELTPVQKDLASITEMLEQIEKDLKIAVHANGKAASQQMEKEFSAKCYRLVQHLQALQKTYTQKKADIENYIRGQEEYQKNLIMEREIEELSRRYL